MDHILDESPIITELQRKHWEWMASYYLCTLGEVLRAALPSSFLLESETIVSLVKERPEAEEGFTDDEFLVYEALLHQSALHINDVRSILDRKRVLPVIQSLIEKEVLSIQETILRRNQHNF